MNSKTGEVKGIVHAHISEMRKLVWGHISEMCACCSGMRTFCSLALGAVLFCGVACRVGAEPMDESVELSATDIIRRSHDLLRDESSYATVTMEVVRPRWRRTMSMQAWTHGTSDTFIRVEIPRKDKGVAFLKKGREGWNYIPSIDKVIKIPPSMMMQPWMGSDFTNDDVVRADSIVTDYEHVMRSGHEQAEGASDYWIIEAIPKEKAPVVWCKIVFKVLKHNLVATRIDYWDEDGELVKYCETSAVEKIEGRDVPTTFTMVDVTRKGYRTTIGYSDLTFSPKLHKGLFTTSNLRR